MDELQRNSMRAEGCLIEVNASINIYGFTFEGLMSQMPQKDKKVLRVTGGLSKAWFEERGEVP
jgi:hypothetical protein